MSLRYPGTLAKTGVCYGHPLTSKRLGNRPGMYGTMSLTVRLAESTPLVSDDALIFRQGKILVPVVRNSIVHLTPVILGYDNGYAVEATGISSGDLVAINLGQSAIEGERVQAFSQKSTR